MNWDKKNLKILCLSDFEKRILHSLATAKRLNEIAGETEIIRTSVAYNLKQLIDRGLVQRVKFGKRYRYIALSPTQLSTELNICIDEIQLQNITKKGTRIKTNEDDEFIIHVGPEEIIPAFKQIAYGNKNERIKVIQHHRSHNKIIEKLTPEQTIEWSQAIIKNNIILDATLNEGAYDSYYKEMLSDPSKYKDVTASLEGRMADYSLFPDKRFNYDAEIWISKKTVLIINWEDEVAIEITNLQMTGLLKEMFEYVKQSSKKIDHNKVMRELLDTLKDST